ncbi:winged helix-turn-helix domain-containing protein [Amycolatopsis acidiphila]|uniref:OmpR/PhoB-type domain-containing protein n=1 Tax=Amycolatopsis acidiphila TaxID=715473 RepID=A0A558AHE7_9PSEU|nr:winged helix-turn-helix domain-containing protein [Amycolatopsis acidiphila]TVT23688.1 hypothetical protein FNH06_09315 [Amycolatopsis acidiphila]UIJ58680.1 winged helix-turn-helix domain-containing protein [Amycolatopsis acidiphila]
MAGRAVTLGGPKPRLLLAALLLQPNVVVSTDALVEVLWPGSAPRSAAANIRTYVHSLRRRLAEAAPELEERIHGRAGGYVVTVFRKSSIPHCSNGTSPLPKPHRTRTRRSPLSAAPPRSGAGTCWRTFPTATKGICVDPGTWFDAELRTGVALVELAAAWGLDDLTWRLTAAFTPYFDLRGHHDDWQHTHEIALAAARRAGNLHGQPIVLRNLGQIDLYRDAGLGTVRHVGGQNDRALDHRHETLALFARAGDPHGEAAARIAVGTVWLAQNCYATADRWFSDAYELAAGIGDRHRESHALQRLALLHQSRGNLGAAREELDRAIAIFDELGDDHCVGYAHQSPGRLYLVSGDLAHARLLLVNSLSVHQRNGDHRSEAEAAELLERLEQPVKAREYLLLSLGIWRNLQAGVQEAALTERLRALGGAVDLLSMPGA